LDEAASTASKQRMLRHLGRRPKLTAHQKHEALERRERGEACRKQRVPVGQRRASIFQKADYPPPT
jgi:hypothetical protein